METLKKESYPIHISNKSFIDYDFNTYSKCAIIVDENTRKSCLSLLVRKNVNLEKAQIIEINSGEKNKNILICQEIWKQLSDNSFDRNSLIINLGGGVVCDIGGFAASAYKRGVDFINIPTTLLAMTDASFGGKVGINFNNYKNQIGVFNNPIFVFIYIKFLDTLERKHLLSGFAECIKHALIFDRKYWNELLEIDLENVNWKRIITQSIYIKNTIVEKDPFDKGLRKILNFGHTFGHAIESFYLSKNQEILHGEAVALGIIIESELSKLSQNEKNSIKNFIKKIYPQLSIPKIQDLKSWIFNDKKNLYNKINLSLLDGIGKCSIDNYKEWNEIQNQSSY